MRRPPLIESLGSSQCLDRLVKTLNPRLSWKCISNIRGALNDAITGALVNRNFALVAHAPRLEAIPKLEPRAWI
jgi:hypothetical protein